MVVLLVDNLIICLFIYAEAYLNDMRDFIRHLDNEYQMYGHNYKHVFPTLPDLIIVISETAIIEHYGRI